MASNSSEQINKKDLELILEVNKKAIEVETGVAEQNEEIIGNLEDSARRQEQIIDLLKKNSEDNAEIKKQNEEVKKDLFQIKVLFLTGLLSLITQIIQFFIKK